MIREFDCFISRDERNRNDHGYCLLIPSDENEQECLEFDCESFAIVRRQKSSLQQDILDLNYKCQTEPELVEKIHCFGIIGILKLLAGKMLTLSFSVCLSVCLSVYKINNNYNFRKLYNVDYKKKFHL
jgi:hypothetical protein